VEVFLAAPLAECVLELGWGLAGVVSAEAVDISSDRAAAATASPVVREG